MKRTLYTATIILIAGIAISSCVEDDGCKICKLNTYQNGTVINEGTGVEYCGDELTEYENAAPITIDGKTTKYDCE